MANLELLVLRAFPLFLVALALARRPSGAPAVEREISTRAPRRGEPFDMTMRVAAGSGEIVEAHAPLPASFELVEGSNLAQRSRGGSVAGAAARLKAGARGRHEVPPVRVEAIEPTGLVAPLVREAAPAVFIDVAPRAYVIR